jgi:hypothetical protein
MHTWLLRLEHGARTLPIDCQRGILFALCHCTCHHIFVQLREKLRV